MRQTHDVQVLVTVTERSPSPMVEVLAIDEGHGSVTSGTAKE